MPPLDTGLDASSAQGAALAQVAPWSHARDFFCPTAFDASSAHGAALAQVAPWPRARAFFCPTAFFHCRPFKPFCVQSLVRPWPDLEFDLEFAGWLLNKIRPPLNQ